MQDLNNNPTLTISIISYNRLHYLKATLESAKKCIQYPNIQWIVIDGNSKEIGLKEYLQSKDWINELHFVDCTHVEAMNKILELAKGDYILIWPEDVQFIVEGDWMQDVLEIMEHNPFLASVAFSPLRIPTIKNFFSFRKFRRIKLLFEDFIKFKFSFRKSKLLSSLRGFNILTLGWQTYGIIGSGIPALHNKHILNQIGQWKTSTTNNGSNIIDSSLGGELEMLNRWNKSKLNTQVGNTVLPVAADIINDNLGCKAKVRSGKRYGNYEPPIDGDFYYNIYKQEDVFDRSKENKLISFEEFVKPNGFKLPLDQKGYLKKASINQSKVTEI